MQQQTGCHAHGGAGGDFPVLVLNHSIRCYPGQPRDHSVGEAEAFHEDCGEIRQLLELLQFAGVLRAQIDGSEFGKQFLEYGRLVEEVERDDAESVRGRVGSCADDGECLVPQARRGFLRVGENVGVEDLVEDGLMGFFFDQSAFPCRHDSLGLNAAFLCNPIMPAVSYGTSTLGGI